MGSCVVLGRVGLVRVCRVIGNWVGRKDWSGNWMQIGRWGWVRWEGWR